MPSKDSATTGSYSSPKEHVLVYHHQPKGTPVVKDGLAVVTHAELVSILQAHPTLKLTKKVIPKGSSFPPPRHIDIYQSDLWTESEKEVNKNLPNAGTNLADVVLGFRVLAEKVLGGGGLGELIILSERT